jgi:hypothetical protein
MKVTIKNVSQRTHQFGTKPDDLRNLDPGQAADFEEAYAKKLLAAYPGELVSEDTAKLDFSSLKSNDFSDVGEKKATPEADKEGPTVQDVAALYGATSIIEEDDGTIVLKKGNKEVGRGTLDDLIASAPKA